MIKKPDLICLDLDNTLYDYEICNQSGQEAAKKRGLEFLSCDSNAWEKVFAEARSDAKVRLNSTAASHSRLIYFKGMLDTFGFSHRFDIAVELEKAYWHSFFLRMKLAPHAELFLQTAREKGIPVVILTDLTLEIQIRKLHILGVEDLVTALVSSEEVGEDKPSLNFMEYVSSKLKFAYDYFWMIGDSKEKDGGLQVRGAEYTFFQVAASQSLSSNFKKLTRQLDLL